MEVKNKGGRPPEKRSRLRIKVISTRLTLLEYLTIKREAENCNLSLSDYLYQLLKQGQIVPRISPEEMDILRKLSGQSNNLNQLTKLANTGGILFIVPELLELKKIIIHLINHLSDDWKNNKG
ncbi:plasmid mobilization protein [Butyricimonas hominis]|uniref:Plasmid mobilization relaxosome protein MobC n=1 Tax=Butyricimonas hominis TaxID=2763032 RepID=A0ABR7CYQ6_9BACT|nr:plasmid mobilization relaxosome protein MobC [Butyricimonas hominis]MBC5620295.1 plasmid mobilization relaxosome protein MobC [Butyricimonas hominis]